MKKTTTYLKLKNVIFRLKSNNLRHYCRFFCKCNFVMDFAGYLPKH